MCVREREYMELKSSRHHRELNREHIWKGWSSNKLHWKGTGIFQNRIKNLFLNNYLVNSSVPKYNIAFVFIAWNSCDIVDSKVNDDNTKENALKFLNEQC